MKHAGGHPCFSAGFRRPDAGATVPAVRRHVGFFFSTDPRPVPLRSFLCRAGGVFLNLLALGLNPQSSQDMEKSRFLLKGKRRVSPPWCSQKRYRLGRRPEERSILLRGTAFAPPVWFPLVIPHRRARPADWGSPRHDRGPLHVAVFLSRGQENGPIPARWFRELQ